MSCVVILLFIRKVLWKDRLFFIAGRSSIKIHGKVVQVPFEITFLGGKEGDEEFTFAFLSSPSQKCSLLLTFISVLGIVAYAQ